MELEEIFKKWGIEPDGCQEALDAFVICQLQSHEVVFNEGAAAESFFFIKSGQALVTRKSHDGNKEFLTVIKEGQCFGIVGLMREMERTVTVEAIGRLELYQMDVSYFNKLMHSYPAFAELIQKVSMERLVRTSPLFHDLDDEHIKKVVDIIEERKYAENSVIFNAGDPPDDFFIIVKGTVKVYRDLPHNKHLTFANLSKGDFFGEQGFISNEPRSASVMATEETILLSIPGKYFSPLLKENAAISFNMLKVLSDRLKHVNKEISMARSISFFKGMTIIARPDRCMACKSCEIACSVAKSRSQHLHGAVLEDPLPVKRVHVRKVKEGSEPMIRPEHCYQCQNAPCLDSCKFGAIYRDLEYRTIRIVTEKCVGCGLCTRACPFNVISLIRMEGRKRIALKCTYCSEHQEGPACVRSCPTNALVIGLAPTWWMPSSKDKEEPS